MKLAIAVAEADPTAAKLAPIQMRATLAAEHMVRADAI